jgi:hypothetical protein
MENLQIERYLILQNTIKFNKAVSAEIARILKFINFFRKKFILEKNRHEVRNSCKPPNVSRNIKKPTENEEI